MIDGDDVGWSRWWQRGSRLVGLGWSVMVGYSDGFVSDGSRSSSSGDRHGSWVLISGGDWRGLWVLIE